MKRLIKKCGLEFYIDKAGKELTFGKFLEEVKQKYKNDFENNEWANFESTDVDCGNKYALRLYHDVYNDIVYSLDNSDGDFEMVEDELDGLMNDYFIDMQYEYEKK